MRDAALECKGNVCWPTPVAAECLQRVVETLFSVDIDVRGLDHISYGQPLESSCHVEQRVPRDRQLHKVHLIGHHDVDDEVRLLSRHGHVTGGR